MGGLKKRIVRMEKGREEPKTVGEEEVRKEGRKKKQRGLEDKRAKIGEVRKEKEKKKKRRREFLIERREDPEERGEERKREKGGKGKKQKRKKKRKMKFFLAEEDF